jgi:integrase
LLITKRPLTLLELSRILAGCQYIAWERRRMPLSACAFWRCFILFAYNTGLRIESLLNLRWEWLVPDEDGRNWFEIPEWAMKKFAFRCYVSPAALAAIQPMRVLQKELVFPFPYGYNHARAKFSELLQIAQVPSRGLMANKFHALRRSCNDELVKINPFAAKLQLGHSTRDVTLNHYTSSAVLVEAHTRLPQPPWTADVLSPPAA